MHTFFGELPIDGNAYTALHAHKDNDLFAKHADPIVCQLPFLRSYQKIENIVPLIVNTKKTDLDREKIWSVLADEKGERCYVLCTNHIDDAEAQLLHAYHTTFSEEFLQFGPEYKIS